MAKVRAIFSRKSKYWLPKHAFMQAYHCALRYTEFKHARMPEAAVIEEVARDAAPELSPFLLWYVTDEHMTFGDLEARGIPCSRDMFYDRRRRFYFELAKRIRVI